MPIPKDDIEKNGSRSLYQPPKKKNNHEKGNYPEKPAPANQLKKSKQTGNRAETEKKTILGTKFKTLFEI